MGKAPPPLFISSILATPVHYCRLVRIYPMTDAALTRFSRFYYPLLLLISSPLILVLLLREAYRRRGGWRFLQQRLGFGYSAHTHVTKPIWLHAASVGEVNAILPLLAGLQKQYPHRGFLLTTNTPSGARRAQTVVSAQVQHVYLPIDFHSAVKRFLSRLQPACALITETELWPNLFAECKRQTIPLCIINGRLSSKTLNIPSFLRAIPKTCLRACNHILARSSADQQGFIVLGAEPARVTVLGNIKFAAAATSPTAALAELPQPYLLAASTHADEEQQLVRLWQQIAPANTLLVLAPRHPERRRRIQQQLEALHCTLALRSRNDPISTNTQVYLLDTLGELTAAMQNAQLVFVGGTLVPKGGQNVLEPARVGKAIIVGPYTFNFADEVQALAAQNAIVQVQDIAGLKQVLSELLNNSEKRDALGARAKQVCDANSDIVERYIQVLQDLKIV